MAQQGMQTQLTYGSLTPGAVPLASSLVTNLSGVELAINAADGKLFFKDVAGNVRVLADVAALGATGNASITGGTIDNVVIGGTTPGVGNFTDLRATSLVVPSLVGMIRSNGNAGFSVAVPGADYVSGSMVGAPGGVPPLDSTSKIPLVYLPDNVTGALTYLGTWDANTNTPPLSSGIGTKGYFYKVSVAGSTNLDGTSTWNIGDQVIFNGTIWERVAESTAPVQSVNGMTGTVVITRGGLGAATAGANFDITSLNGLTTPLSVSQGGTGGATVTGVLKGNGGAPFTAAVPGLDFAPPTTGTATQLLAPNGGGGFTNITLGAGLSLSSGILSATGGGGTGSGTVTSVNASGGSTGLTFSGGPVTTNGTLTLSGTLAVTAGGTGRSTLNGILKGAGTAGIVSAVAGSDYAPATPGTATQLLASNGAGGFTAVTVGSGLSYTAGVLINTGGGGGTGTGTVTAVDVVGGTTGLTFSGGPVTTAGVITMAGRLNVQSGGTGAATLTGLVRGNGTSPFSAAVANVDYALPPTGVAGTLLGNAGSGTFANITIGTGLNLSSGVLTATGGGGSGNGTVTSVNVSGGTTGLTFSGGPITTSGTLSMAGTLAVANGGTGTTTLSGLLKGNGTSPVVMASPGVDYALPPTGTASQLLSPNGSGGFSPVNVGGGLTLASGTLSSSVTATIPDGSLTDIKIASDAAIQATKLSFTSAGSSAVARTIASKLSDFLSVKDFGAKGDGATNDSIAVAAAVAAAQASGKSVFFPDGSYSLPSVPVLSGKVILWGTGNAILKGTLTYTQATFPSAQDGALASSAPYFAAVGLNFESTTTSYALILNTNEQGKTITTFGIHNCRFYGYAGIFASNMQGFSITECGFYNSVNGVWLAGCSQNLIANNRFQGQAQRGLTIIQTSNHGSGGFDKAGGSNHKIAGCEFVYCVTGIGIYNASSTYIHECLSSCALPVLASGSEVTVTSSRLYATNAPVASFSNVPGYAAPPTSGVALYGCAGGYSGGDRTFVIDANNCTFASSVANTSPVVLLDGYYNATYPKQGANQSLIDCTFQFDVSCTALTLLTIQYATAVRLVGNKFVSQNMSSQLQDAWRAPNCDSVVGIVNNFYYCTVSNAIVGSSYEKHLTSTYISATDPGAVGAGSFWVQP